MAPDEWESVAVVYFQHFQVEKDVVKDMLQQKYKAYPVNMNWQNARTVVLKMHSRIIAASTLRYHEKFSFVEVVLFATHRDHERCGFGGLLSSIILAKSHDVQCNKILLRASKAATPFWCSQGFKPYAYGSSDLLGAYNDHHCLQLPETCQMTRDVSAKHPWIEFSLGKCKARDRLLGDLGATVLPVGPRRGIRSGLDGERKRGDAVAEGEGTEPKGKLYIQVLHAAAPEDAEAREGCGLFDNTKLAAEDLFPAVVKKRRRQPPRVANMPSGAPTDDGSPDRRPGGQHTQPSEYLNDEQQITDELQFIQRQLKLLQKRRRAILKLGDRLKQATVTAPLPRPSPAAPSPAPPSLIHRKEPTPSPVATPPPGWNGAKLGAPPPVAGYPHPPDQYLPKMMLPQASNPLLTQWWMVQQMQQMQQVQQMQWLNAAGAWPGMAPSAPGPTPLPLPPQPFPSPATLLMTPPLKPALQPPLPPGPMGPALTPLPCTRVPVIPPNPPLSLLPQP